MLPASHHPTTPLDRPPMHVHSAMTFLADDTTTPLSATLPTMLIMAQPSMPTHSNTLDKMVNATPVSLQQPMLSHSLAIIAIEHDANPTSSLDPDATGCHCMTSYHIAVNAFSSKLDNLNAAANELSSELAKLIPMHAPPLSLCPAHNLKSQHPKL